MEVHCMAYLDRNRHPHRASIVAGVLCLEALAIYGIVSGLSVRFFPREQEPRIVGGNFPLPKPPEATPSAKPAERPVLGPTRAADPVIDLGPRGDPVIGLPPNAGPIATPTATPIADPVSDPPLFTPRAARPIGNPANWVSTNDYPARDLREGNQGTTGFELTVGTDGRVVACQVIRSSGFAGLDKATCDALSRRARFTPASDASGAKVTGRYASSIRWVIPD
jgi:protein TonB